MIRFSCTEMIYRRLSATDTVRRRKIGLSKRENAIETILHANISETAAAPTNSNKKMKLAHSKWNEFWWKRAERPSSVEWNEFFDFVLFCVRLHRFLCFGHHSRYSNACKNNARAPKTSFFCVQFFFAVCICSCFRLQTKWSRVEQRQCRSHGARLARVCIYRFHFRCATKSTIKWKQFNFEFDKTNFVAGKKSWSMTFRAEVREQEATHRFTCEHQVKLVLIGLFISFQFFMWNYSLNCLSFKSG